MSRAPNLPIGWKPYSDFSRLSNNPQSSAHFTEFVAKLKKEREKKPSKWVFKKFDNPVLAQAEAAAAALYRLVIPEHIPKIRVVCDRYGKPIGTVSKFFKGAIPLKEYLGPNFGAEGNAIESCQKMAALIDGGFAKILALAWLYEEDDGHLNNYAVIKQPNNKILVVKYDFDMSVMSIVGMEQYRGDRKFQFTRKTVEKRFVFSQKDFDHFPDLRDCTPYYWPMRYEFSAMMTEHGYPENYVKAFQSYFSNNEKFLLSAYSALLQVTLHADEKKIFGAHIADLVLTELFQKMITKKHQLYHMFLSSERFRACWSAILFKEQCVVREHMQCFVNNRYSEKSKVEIDSPELIENRYYFFTIRFLMEKWYHCINLLKNFLEKNTEFTTRRFDSDLFHACKTLYDSAQISFDDLYRFVKSVYVIKNDAAQFNHSSIEWRECVDRLGRALQHFIVLCGLMNSEVEKKLSCFYCYQYQQDEFDAIPECRIEKIMPVVKSWLFDAFSDGVLTRKADIQRFFFESMEKYDDSRAIDTTKMANPDAGFLGSSWVSFFRPAPESSSDFSEESRKTTIRLFQNITNRESLEAALQEFLSIKSQKFAIAHQYFFSCVFREVVCSFFNEGGFNDNTYFSEYVLSLREIAREDSEEIGATLSRNFFEIQDVRSVGRRANSVEEDTSSNCFDDNSSDDFVRIPGRVS